MTFNIEEIVSSYTFSVQVIVKAIYTSSTLQKKDKQEAKEQICTYICNVKNIIAMLFSNLRKEHLQCYTPIPQSKFSKINHQPIMSSK